MYNRDRWIFSNSIETEYKFAGKYGAKGEKRAKRKRPKPERKTYFRWTMRKILEDGPKPTPGFYIVKDSIISGTNKYTGMSYLRYTEQRIKEVKRE